MKTQITDWLFLYNAIRQVIDNKLNIKLKIFYFTLEMSKEEKMLQAFSNILYLKEGIRIAPQDLKSTHQQRVLDQNTLDAITRNKEYFEKIEEIVEFIDDVRNPFGIYKMMREYANNNGTQYKKTVEFVNNKTGEITNQEIDDYYQPDNPDEYVIILIDHISLISTEDSRNLQESIVKLSSDYLIRLRNKYNYIPVVIQQQSASQESIDNMKANRLKPTLDGLGDSKLTGRDANLILGLFSPFRHEIKQYHDYDITRFRDNIRFLEILGGRNGGGGTICPLYFDGAVNYFKELPLPHEHSEMDKVYQFLNTIRK